MIATPDGNQWTVLVGGDQTGGRFAVVETREQRGAEPPRHLHHHEDELLYVLEGHVTVDRDGERLDCPAGTWLFLPRGSDHAFSVETAEARLLIVLSPAGLEDCLDELRGSDNANDTSLTVERLVTTAARYGVEITGPRWKP